MRPVHHKQNPSWGGRTPKDCEISRFFFLSPFRFSTPKYLSMTKRKYYKLLEERFYQCTKTQITLFGVRGPFFLIIVSLNWSGERPRIWQSVTRVDRHDVLGQKIGDERWIFFSNCAFSISPSFHSISEKLDANTSASISNVTFYRVLRFIDNFPFVKLPQNIVYLWLNCAFSSCCD